MSRPALTPGLSEAEFRRWYWLRSELQAFCRQHKIPSGGNKIALADRIAAHLAGRVLPESARAPTPRGSMPTHFEPETRIGPGWRCSQALRQYFAQVHGRGFKFNEALRTFIRERAGHTLAEASAHYLESLKSEQRPISAQFEYNRHMREYYAQHPGATAAQARAAWWAKRGK